MGERENGNEKMGERKIGWKRRKLGGKRKLMEGRKLGGEGGGGEVP
jgi:hypothetical protein